MTGLLDRLWSRLDCVHFRDIWSGIPLAGHEKARAIPALFEVNGLPSLELPAHYPGLSRNQGLMDMIRNMEDTCLGSADRILTVSGVTKRYLVSRGARAEIIDVLPNTAEMPEGFPDVGADTAEDTGPGPVVYAGTLAPWQGIGTLIRAYSLMGTGSLPRLVLACSSRKNLKPVRKMAARQGIEGATDIRIGLERKELFALYRRASLVVAPLARSARNELQGCSPLKIVESMACGTPVVASRLPVCEELVTDGVDGLLVSPDSPRALASAMERLLGDTALRENMGKAAQRKFSEELNHGIWKNRLYEIYEKIIPH